MGTEFFWFYDVILAGILIGMVFLGVKRGFVRMLLSLLSVLIAFLVALVASNFISTWVYDSFVKDSLKTSISDTINEALGDNVLTQLSGIDMEKATLGGETLTELNISPDDAGKVTIDLSKLDVSATGIDKVDLSAFGIPSGSDLSSLKLGTVQIFAVNVEKYGLGTMVLAEILSEKLMSSSVATAITDVVTKINESVPMLNLDETTLGLMGNTLLTDIVVSLIKSSGDPGQSVVDNIVKPVVLIPIRTIAFIIIFIVVSILLSLIIKATALINKIPLIGSLNELLGAVLGLAEGLIIVFIVVILVHLAVSVTDNTLIFLNEMTIDKSFAFSWVYDFKFLDFLNVKI